MITRTIGVSGNHTDIAAWVSYVQSNYVSAGNLTDDQTGAVTVGGCTVSTAQVVSGWAPGGSGYTTTLTYDPASSGAAWYGQNCRSNAFYYNTARGAFIASSYSSGPSGGAVMMRVEKWRVIGLMIKATGGYMAALRSDTTTVTDCLTDGNILWATSDTEGALHLATTVEGTNNIVQNNVLISERGVGGSSGGQSQGGSTFANRIKWYDNVFWADQGVPLRAGSGSYIEVIGNSFIARTNSCAVSARDAQTNGSNNATNNAAFNNTGYGAGTITGLTSTQFSITLANEYVGVTTGAAATDFRLKSGGTQLQGTNITISGVTVDATGVTRTSPTDIGPYQFATGGNVYNVSLSESGSANDNVSSVCTFPRAVNESPSITDAYSSQATQNVSIGESASAVEVISQGSVFPATLAESASPADTISNVATFPRTISESAPIAEVVNAQNNTFNVSIAESGSANNTQAATAIFPRAITESGSAVDTVAASAAFAANLSEIMSAANVQAALVVYPVSIAESAPITDVQSSAIPGGTDIIETMNITDVYSATVIYATSIAEGMTATNTQAAALIMPAAIAETATPTDAYSAIGIFVRSIAEGAGASDFYICASQLTAAIAESMAADDVYVADEIVRRATACNTLSGAPRVRRLEGAPRVRTLGGRSCE